MIDAQLEADVSVNVAGSSYSGQKLEPSETAKDVGTSDK